MITISPNATLDMKFAPPAMALPGDEAGYAVCFYSLPTYLLTLRGQLREYLREDFELSRERPWTDKSYFSSSNGPGVAKVQVVAQHAALENGTPVLVKYYKGRDADATIKV
jgi:hypothetical protein